jgi:hypothetical protein
MSDEPHLRLAGFSLWVRGRQFPDLHDYWDGNWLDVRARVEAAQAIVEAHGPIIYAPKLESFLEELNLLDTTLAGSAALKCTEPHLDITLRGDARGHVTATVKITPDHMTQSHRFIFEFDQTYLKPLIADCRRILADYPIRGNRAPPSRPR